MQREYWLRMKRRTADGEVLWEARCDLMPDVAGFGDTADEAYDAACAAIDGLLADRAKSTGNTGVEK